MSEGLSSGDPNFFQTDLDNACGSPFIDDAMMDIDILDWDKDFESDH